MNKLNEFNNIKDQKDGIYNDEKNIKNNLYKTKNDINK